MREYQEQDHQHCESCMPLAQVPRWNDEALSCRQCLQPRRNIDHDDRHPRRIMRMGRLGIYCMVNVTLLCTCMNYEFGCFYARPPDYYSDNQLLCLLREPQQFHNSGILQYLFAQCFMQLRASRTVLNTHAGQVQKLWTSVHNSV